MTFLTNTPLPHATTATGRQLNVLLRRLFGKLGRLVEGCVASMIAEVERRGQLAALRHLGDRELKDIGLHRCQIESALAEAARDRLKEHRLHGI